MRFFYKLTTLSFTTIRMSNRDLPIRMPMKPNSKQIREKRRTLGRVLCFCLSVVMIAGVLVWLARIPVLTYLVRHELDRRGLSDVTFQIASVRLDRIVLREVQMGVDPSVVRVDWLEARFSFPEIFKGEVDRVRASGIQLPLIAGENTITVPLLEPDGGDGAIGPLFGFGLHPLGSKVFHVCIENGLGNFGRLNLAPGACTLGKLIMVAQAHEVIAALLIGFNRLLRERLSVRPIAVGVQLASEPVRTADQRLDNLLSACTL
jgi:hypothetical protein